MAKVSIGRSRLPPEEMRCVATSGIMVTSEPVRARMVALTRSMSSATSSVRRWIDSAWGVSNGRTTAKTLLQGRKDNASIETLWYCGKDFSGRVDLSDGFRKPDTAF